MTRALRWGVPAAAVMLAVLYFGASYAIVAQVATSTHREQEAFPEDYGLPYEDVEFTSRTDGLTLRGWYMERERGGPTALFVHGVDSVRSGNNALLLASMLGEQGFNVLLFDLRGHGSSEGDRVSGGDHERHDVLGALDFLEGRGVPPGKVGVLGVSMGAAAAALAVVEAPSVEALVLDSVYASMSDLIAQEVGNRSALPVWAGRLFAPGVRLLARLALGIDIGAVVAERAVSELDYPVLIIHGGDDDRVLVEHGRRVHAAAHADSELWVLEGIGHADAFDVYPEEYARRVSAYFRARLGE